MSVYSKLFRVMAVIAIVAAVAFGEISSGKAGELTWVISDDCTLTISGNGAMPDIPSTIFYWHRSRDNITKVVIADGVTSIGYMAFAMCRNITEVTIPNSVTSIGEIAFSGCSNLAEVTIPNSVTSIGNSAFSFCEGLTKITIPGSVAEIGESPFSQCYLTEINVDESNKNYASIDGVLFNKVKTTLVQYHGSKNVATYTIPNSVKIIGNGAFSGCSSLTKITIPNSVTSIGNFAFNDCIGLTEVTIPNSVTSIGKNAFERCKGLTSFVIGNSVTSIGDYAFLWCSGLTSIVIPNSVTSIGILAFFKCDGLTEVTIPNSLTSIGHNTFESCNLKQIVNQATKPQEITVFTFDVIREDVKLYVPDKSLAAYKAADVWKDFDIHPISTMPTAIGKTAANKTAAISFAGIRNGEININLKAGSYTAEIYNLQGRLVSSVNINALNGLNATGIRTNNLSKGMFILNVKQAGASVLKQKVRI